MLYRAFLIKYAEIGIKGNNRYLFENALRDQIIRTLREVDGDFYVSKEQGRIYVECRSEAYDYEETVAALQRVFGISSICPMKVIEEKEWETICQQTAAYVRDVYQGKAFTFKVEAKRADKQFPIPSPEICAQMGGYLLEQFPELSVDVHSPQVRIMLEIRSKVYLYSQEIPGPCGMPVGCNGKAMLLLSGGIDSPVAGFRISRRGVSLEATYFHAPPYTSERAKQKVIDLARMIARWTGPILLHVVNFTDIQLKIYEVCPHDELTIIMRRYMMRIAEAIAKEDGCLGLVTGESIGQVASQTMQSLASTNEVCDLPVYRPLISFDKQEIVREAQQIGTFETSILPYEDCCTIFVAKHPVTKPNRISIRKSEAKLKGQVEDLVETALASRERILVTAKDVSRLTAESLAYLS